MQTYELLVKNRSVMSNSEDMTLVRTSVGMDQVHVLFDNQEWLGFPVTITFAQGDDVITQSLVLSEIASGEWAAESYAPVPHEVIDMVGRVRVTLQGTDSQGRHIITAKGSPLIVEEAGDILPGGVPSGAPSVNEWQQAYADAMAAVNQASSLVSNLQSQLEAMVEEAEGRLDDKIDVGVQPATRNSIGGVIIGDGIAVDGDGRISVTSQASSGGGMTEAQASVLVNLQRLAVYGFDTEFDSSGLLRENVMVKESALPLAKLSKPGIVKADGTTTTLDTDGTLHAQVYELPLASQETVGGLMVDGSTIRMNGSGMASVPIAGINQLGLVRPDGVTITIGDGGVLTASGSGGSDGYVLPKATSEQLGGVKVDGETIVVDGDGVISLAIADADGVGF